MSTLKPTRRLSVTLQIIGLILLLALFLNGCGFNDTAAPGELPRPESSEVRSEPAPVDEKMMADVEEGTETEVTAAEPMMEESPAEAPASMGKTAGAMTATPAPLPTAAGEFYAAEAEEASGETIADDMLDRDSSGEASLELAVESSASSAGAVGIQQQAEPLKAGEVDDNAEWDDYLLYRRDYAGPQINDLDISERYVIEVEDGQGNPVLGANVMVYLDGQERQEIYNGRTYANGQMLFHPLALDIPARQADRFRVEVAKDDLQQSFTLTRFEAQASSNFTERWTVTLDEQSRADRLNLDVLFLIDATGSMADEIDKIQNTIFDVAAQIDALPGQPDVRYGMVTYRDRGDLFVSNTYDFTPDVTEFHDKLKTVRADGGGDYPESLNEGLHNALHSVEWRGENTVQLIFLVADAPPHLDYAQDYDYAQEMAIAAQRGIKIFPIASSGLDDQGEYIFRQLAQYTQGRFIFLTYAGPTNSGAPGETTTHHVEDYSVENLDSLLVKLVQEELAYQSPQMAQVQ